MGRLLLFLIILSLVAFSFLSDVQSASFKIVNKCRHTIWPGLLSGATSPPLPTTGFTLESGKSRIVKIPKSWSGRIWARTLCGQDSDGKFSCATADCGSGKVQCVGGAKPPATLAEFTLNGADGLDFYDVSLVDGYNLPMLIVAKDGTRGGCSATGCLVDLNGGCPAELRVARSNGSRGSVACRSACEAFGDPRFCCSEAYSTPDIQKLLGVRKDGAQLPLVNKTMMYLSRLQSGGSSPSVAKNSFLDWARRKSQESEKGRRNLAHPPPSLLSYSEGSACEAFRSPEYCCSGAYGSPATCRPSIYSEMFKAACPRSYSYAYDDATSTFTCSGADYTVTFCPSSPSQKSSRDTTTNPMTSTTTSPGSGTVTGTGSEGAVVYTGADNGVVYNTVTGSGSSSVTGGETMLPDGSYLAGLAMGDSPRRTASTASFLLILFLLL
ncbi:hypothetical protein JHK84_030844 [Glycine max]|nr:hypothetical protein JHK86_030722 [Glycine max]KAG5145301.1 hypothetical protein JHK84_030844 [Glycine max]